MIDWVKFNSIIANRDHYEKHPDEMLITIIECWPDNMLRNILRKSRERGHEDLVPVLEEQMKKRGLKE